MATCGLPTAGPMTTFEGTAPAEPMTGGGHQEPEPVIPAAAAAISAAAALLLALGNVRLGFWARKAVPCSIPVQIGASSCVLPDSVQNLAWRHREYAGNATTEGTSSGHR